MPSLSGEEFTLKYRTTSIPSTRPLSIESKPFISVSQLIMLSPKQTLVDLIIMLHQETEGIN